MDGHRDTQRRAHVKMEAEIGAMLARAGKHLGLSETGRTKEGSFPKSFVGIWYC